MQNDRNKHVCFYAWMILFMYATLYEHEHFGVVGAVIDFDVCYNYFKL